MRNLIVNCSFILGCLGLSACSMLDRHPRSGYGDEMESGFQAMQDLSQERANKNENEAREELGIQNRALSEPEGQAVQERLRLKRLEGRIATKREKKQYYSVRSALKNDRERVYFLSLPTYEARERWAANRGLGKDETYSDDVAQTIEANDISLGMTQKAVMQSWGDPDVVETAGSPLYGYERWKYNRYVSGGEGYQKEMRVVYFEGGRVVGWERM